MLIGTGLGTRLQVDFPVEFGGAALFVPSCIAHEQDCLNKFSYLDAVTNLIGV
jgi:hypothetical protein